ncbi:hypothetical protein Tco_1144333 [Tanacetum coccineum]
MGYHKAKKYEELSVAEKLQADCDLKATNIVLQCLPPDVVKHRAARMLQFNNCQGEVHMARQCTQPKRPMNTAWFKEKEMLAEAHESGQILDEEQLAFLADPGIPYNVISEVPHSEPYHNDMDNQSVHVMQNFEQTPVVDFTDNEITSDSNIIPYS